MQSLSEKIKIRLSRKTPLELFTMEDIIKRNDSSRSINKELNKMVLKGEIGKIKRGIFFIPQKSRFGLLKPNSFEIIKFLTRRKGKITGYISGPEIHNKLGLTSQVPATITIATTENTRSGEFAGHRIKYIKAYGEINEKNIPILQILDTINSIKKVSDSDITQSFKRLIFIISRLPFKDQLILLEQAKYYPPKSRALTGLMLNNIWLKNPDYLKSLNNLRNSFSKTIKFNFNMGITLVNKEEWSIFEPEIKPKNGRK